MPTNACRTPLCASCADWSITYDRQGFAHLAAIDGRGDFCFGCASRIVQACNRPRQMALAL